MGKRFVVVVKTQNGNVERYDMRQWLRQNPEYIPRGMTTDSQTNSWSLRAGLRREGWGYRESDAEALLLRPDVATDADLAPTARDLSAPTDQASGAREEFDFDFERSLRDFIVRNLSAIPIAGRRLRLFVDGANRDGVEYPTNDVGFVDVLAIDDGNDFFVFELKLKLAPDEAMGQLTRYMGWVKEHLAKDRAVYGVIVAKEIDERLRYAALVVPNVSLLRYELEFRLIPAGLRDQPPARRLIENSTGS